jgi:hypothetical protein
MITLWILLQSHCVNSSLSDLLYSSVLLIPIFCLYFLRASTATIIHRHCIHFSSGTSWELLRTELASFGTRYITSTPTTHRKHFTRLLLLKRVHQSLHSNGRGVEQWIHYRFITQQRAATTHTSIVACVITCLLSRCLVITQHTHGFCQCRLSTADHALQQQSSHLNGRMLDCR